MKGKRKTPARQKILEAASNLFYTQGFHSTTLDQIIDESGVSRPTVYSHFSTKEDIGIEYLQTARTQEIEGLLERVKAESEPKERALAIVRNVQARMKETSFRGCPFFNIVSELVEREHPMVQEARTFVDTFHSVINEEIENLKQQSSAHSGINAKQVARSYFLIICGAMMACQELGEAWPLDHAVEQARSLLES